MNAKAILAAALIAAAPALIFAAPALIFAVPALGQATGAINVLGTVDAVGPASITLQGGQSFRLAPDVLVVANRPATLADIKPDDFIASAATHGADGRLHSTELRIFPPAMRGLGEGQRPMNDAGGQTMTNATVTGTAIVNGSNAIEVTFGGRVSELVLDPGVPVTRIEPADRSLVRSGTKVRVQGAAGADGETVTRVTIQ